MYVGRDGGYPSFSGNLAYIIFSAGSGAYTRGENQIATGGRFGFEFGSTRLVPTDEDEELAEN